MLPSLLIIGAQRAGTSSLYRYLGQHPDVAPSLRKETEFFSHYYTRGEPWYRAHFPLGLRGSAHTLVRKTPLVTFEATPDYLLDPRSAGRAASLVPDARIIALLRDPVERAFSHWRHMSRLGIETLPFAAAIEAEDSRIGEARERIAADPNFTSVDFLRYSYLERGGYAEQLARWLDEYGRERVLVVRSEEFFEYPGLAFDRILRFVGLRSWEPDQFANHSYAIGARPTPNQEMPEDIRMALYEHFKPLNEQLSNIVGRDFTWPTSAMPT